ncbi:MAG: OB-fold domain-containing protein [Ilumatobacteraceae bacterium]
MLLEPPRCSNCFADDVVEATFGSEGTVWSSTVVRIPVPGRTPPYALAYVDIDDGPRVLAHVEGQSNRIAVGARVELAPTTEAGDLTVEVLS